MAGRKKVGVFQWGVCRDRGVSGGYIDLQGYIHVQFIFVSEVEYLYGYCYYIHVVLTARVPLEVSVVGTQECT